MALLLHCAGGRANFMLRVVRPEAVQTFAEGHSDGLWSCLRNILGVTLDTNPTVRDIATMPLSLGGMGLRNAVRTSPAAFWASWADCLSMVRERHPEIATTILRRMGDPIAPPTLVAAQTVADQLVGAQHRDILLPQLTDDAAISKRTSGRSAIVDHSIELSQSD